MIHKNKKEKEIQVHQPQLSQHKNKTTHSRNKLDDSPKQKEKDEKNHKQVKAHKPHSLNTTIKQHTLFRSLVIHQNKKEKEKKHKQIEVHQPQHSPNTITTTYILLIS